MLIEVCQLLFKVISTTIIDTVKALLPTGFLPRKSVAGQIVLITGSGSGIGRSMAIEFAKLGSRLVLWDLNEKWNQETAKKVKDLGADVYTYTVNLAKRNEIYECAKRVKDEVGEVDILINNAGIVTGKKLFENPDELMELTMSVNCQSHFFTTKAFLPHMLEVNKGHVVTVASIAGIIGVAGMVDYCASKFGAVGFSQSLKAELNLLKKYGVHVTTICPYFISTGMFNGVETKFPSLFPILTPEYVVEQIMEAVLTNREIIYMPKTCYVAAFLQSILPPRASQLIAEYLGASTAMENFVGRENGMR